MANIVTYKKSEILLILVLMSFVMSCVAPYYTFCTQAEVVYDISDKDAKDEKEKETDTKDKIRAALSVVDYYLVLSRCMIPNLSSYFAPPLEVVTPPPEYIS